MGLYADISADIAEAFDGDLADAVKTITVIEFNDSTYDPVAGTNTSVKTNRVIRGVVTSLSEEQVRSDSTLINGVGILILDTEKSVAKFEVGMKLIIENDPQTYKLVATDTDPANVTHSLTCGRWS